MENFVENFVIKKVIYFGDMTDLSASFYAGQ